MNRKLVSLLVVLLTLSALLLSTAVSAQDKVEDRILDFLGFRNSPSHHRKDR